MRNSEYYMPLKINNIKVNGINEYGEPLISNELRLEPGTITVLIGANGSGKTFLLESIAGLRPESDIEATFGDDPVWQKKGRRRRLNTAGLMAYGYASQSPEEQLIARTVRDELAFALKPYGLPEAAVRTRTEDALKTVGWDESWLGREPQHMSGGERRRAALACLFAVPVPWILLDEPTAGLDAAAHHDLARALKRRAAEGQGILLISHDTDWAIPIADQVLLMGRDRSIRTSVPEQLLEHPEWFAECGMGIPAWLYVLSGLRRLGVEVSVSATTESTAAAAAIARKMNPETSTGSIEKAQEDQAARVASAHNETAPHSELYAAVSQAPRKDERAESPLANFDPRSVWLGYVLLSTAILLQKSWPGIAAGAVITAAAIAAGRIPLRRWHGAIKAMLTFSFTAALIAGFEGGSLGLTWDIDGFLASIQSLARPVLVMLLGFGLPIVITPLRLRRALEQTLAVRGHVPRVGQTAILTVTLLLRFIPVLLAEWQRFAKQSLARGKTARFKLRKLPGQLRESVLPFMLALFRIAEQAASALESRGVGRRPYPTVRRTLRWRLKDFALTLSCLLILLLFGYYA
ncbi:ATP-binding cassette domain-containing protein [Paenibacillus methanolicus]|uniref:Energy-coupling factor transport system ATP-binding protein n=1 Tax=Paenibacillus methanolicus TaxID=582686 RepID=A0A5S5CJ42_9BACL|nr:ATP-binding cassette domain-containing protein [Paenibacillus methanolicus]TYP79544.1 energy-coupling factor transport system ATP-binding protein [Paenibacillus methanolicus]